MNVALPVSARVTQLSAFVAEFYTNVSAQMTKVSRCVFRLDVRAPLGLERDIDFAY